MRNQRKTGGQPFLNGFRRIPVTENEKPLLTKEEMDDSARKVLGMTWDEFTRLPRKKKGV